MSIFTKNPSPYKRLDPERVELILPEEMSLYPFQEPLTRSMLRHYHNGSKGVYNACDQGLGKTIMSVVLANTARENRILIVCPAGLRGNWNNEIRLFDIKHSVIRTVYASKDVRKQGTYKWMVTSYALLNSREVRSAIAKFKPTFVVFDEAQALAGNSTQRTNRARELYNFTRNVMFVSGTPIRTGAKDIFPVCNMIMPRKFPSYQGFLDEFSLQKTVPWGDGVEYYGGKNLDALGKILKDNFFVRMSKAQALPDLPPKTFQDVELDCGSFDDTLSKQQVKRVLDAVDGGEDPEVFLQKKHVMVRRREIGLAKLKAGRHFIKDLLDSDTPLIIGCYFRDTIAVAEAGFKKYNPIVLTGSTPGNKRQTLVDQFNRGESNLFIMQVEAGGVGLNLQARCSTMILLEAPYSPADINQFVDRTHRIGQKNSVNVYVFVARGSYDQQVMKIVIKKLKMINKLIAPTEDYQA